MDAGSVLIFSFFLYSLFSIFAFNIDLFTYNDIHPLPFIYLFILTLISISPITRFSSMIIQKIQKPSDWLLKIYILIYSISSIISLLKEIPNLKSGLVRIIMDSAGGLEVYRESMDKSVTSLGDGTISNFYSIISNAFSDIGVLLLFYYLTLRKRNKLLTFMLIVSCLSPIIANAAISQRGPMISCFFTLIGTFFVLKKWIFPHIVNVINKISLCLSIIIVSLLFFITISRFGNGVSAINSVCIYVGQANLNFNNYGFNNGGIRYGDRTIPVFKKIIGFENVPNNFWERREKYPDLKINDESFIGYIGDFVLDFGPFVAAIIIILFTLFINSHIIIYNKELLFHQLILIHFVLCLCIQGGFYLFTFSDYGAFKIIISFVSYLIFRLDYESRKVAKGCAI